MVLQDFMRIGEVDLLDASAACRLWFSEHMLVNVKFGGVRPVHVGKGL